MYFFRDQESESGQDWSPQQIGFTPASQFYPDRHAFREHEDRPRNFVTHPELYTVDRGSVREMDMTDYDNRRYKSAENRGALV